MEENVRFWPRHPGKRSSQSTAREKQNKSPATSTKVNKLATNANMSNGKLGIGYANSAGSAAIEPNMKMSDRTHNKAPGATGRDRQNTEGF